MAVRTEQTPENKREVAKMIFTAVRALAKIEHPSRAVQDAMRALYQELSVNGFSIVVDSGTGRKTLSGPAARAKV